MNYEDFIDLVIAKNGPKANLDDYFMELLRQYCKLEERVEVRLKTIEVSLENHSIWLERLERDSIKFAGPRSERGGE